MMPTLRSRPNHIIFLAVLILGIVLPGSAFQTLNPANPSSGNTEACTPDQLATGACSPQAGSGEQNTPSETMPKTPVIRNEPSQPTPAPSAKNLENGNGENERRAQAEKTEAENGALEFQNLTTISVGKKLPLFGRDLFVNVPDTFAPEINAPVPASYIIDTGDQLQLRGWGQVDIDYHAVVDPNGNIFVPQVGNIHVAGVKNEELSGYLKAQISKVFHNFELVATVMRPRSVTVFVVGQAKRPGSFTLSALSTVYNALFATGGPSLSGSLRKIEVRRADHTLAVIDLYDFILHGDKSKDVTLQNGDVIYIPPVGPLAAVAGSVNVPGIYELKDESTLNDVLQLAGGLSTVAAGQNVMVERIKDKLVRQMDEFSLDSIGLKHRIRDGDLITVLPISQRFNNAITLRGNVSVPGRYPWHPGMRVHDLIPNRDALITETYWLHQNSAASSDRAIGEKTEVPGTEGTAAEPVTTPSATAGVQKAPPVVRNQETLHNEIRRNAPDIDWDYAVVQRLDHKELTSELLPFNLRNALDHPGSEDDLTLKAGDIVTIFSQADIQVPFNRQSKFVRIEGEVKSPGVYKVETGEDLRHLVERIGGLTSQAYLYGSVFTRESTRVAQQKQMNDALDRLSVEVERTASVRAQNLSGPEEGIGLGARVESQRRLVENLRKVRATGRIVLEIKPTDDNAADLPKLQLEDGDRLIIPHEPSTVRIIGAVYNENDFIYRKGQRVRDCIRRSGGLTRSADSGRIYVIRADGSVQGANRGAGWLSAGFKDTRLYPGDTVVVPEKLDQTKFTTMLKDYTQIFSQLALGIAAVHVLNLP